MWASCVRLMASIPACAAVLAHPPTAGSVSDLRHCGMPNAVSAGQALAVLQLIARHPEPVPAASIARDLGLPRSSVYHLLKVLHARGYVTHYVEERRFGLGQAAYELGSAYQRQAPLARVARAPMRRLVDQCGRNAHFATLDGRDVIYL